MSIYQSFNPMQSIIQLSDSSRLAYPQIFALHSTSYDTDTVRKQVFWDTPRPLSDVKS